MIIKKLLSVVLILSSVTSAQYIEVKSLPVATGSQLELFPSSNRSMGGVNIGLSDSLGDLFNNPGNNYSVSANSIFVQPNIYTVSGNLGSALTLPVTYVFNRESYFGAITYAFQKFEKANLSNDFFWYPSDEKAFADRNVNNNFVFFSLGKRLSEPGLSIGMSGFWAGLKGIGGIDLLYRNNGGVKEDGYIAEIRSGVFYKKDEITFEAVALYNHFKMEHEVKSISPWFWSAPFWNIEKHLDKTDTYGIHLAYNREDKSSGITYGFISTVNYKNHPKIPNYTIMNIPRDPGNSWAFNFGLGLGYEKPGTRVGFDFIFEPILSHTWANAEEAVTTVSGNTIAAGDKTVENHFTFTNTIIRAGLEKTYGLLKLKIGLQIYTRSYELDQSDYQFKTTNGVSVSWAEYTWTWGTDIHFKYFDLMYSGHILTGAGIPGVRNNLIFIENALSTNDIIAAPSGEITKDYKTTTFHMFLISCPLNF